MLHKPFRIPRTQKNTKPLNFEATSKQLVTPFFEESFKTMSIIKEPQLLPHITRELKFVFQPDVILTYYQKV